MSFPLFDLTGRRAFVTGSSQGIGSAIAAGLAEHGAAIVLNGRDEAKLQTTADRLRKAGHRVTVAAFDVTDARAVQQGCVGHRARGWSNRHPGEQRRDAVSRAARRLSYRAMGAVA